jgi:pimeloyl-[acyl-carrier protein] methyl ester esterase
MNAPAMRATWQLLAAHGWGSDQRCWDGFGTACGERGWKLQCQERGYGRYAAASPSWQTSGKRALLLNSLGTHLIAPELLAEAEAVVLLASFGRFVPLGAEGEQLRQVLRSMRQRLLRGDIQGLFAEFRPMVAAPQPLELLPPGVEDGELPARGLQLLIQDLKLLEKLKGLPAAFPVGVPVLIVEGEADGVVHPLSRIALKQQLPSADLLSLTGVGHGLLVANLVPQVLDWLEGLNR